MKLSELKSFSRVGHLVRQIIKEEWPMRLGDWQDTFARCELLADTASHPAGVGKWTGKEVHALLYQARIISYDQDSGLWYCSIRAPKQDYPDGWESQAKLERMERRKLKAELEALGLSTPRQKAKKERESATPPASTLPEWAQPSPNAKKKRKPKLDWAQLKWGRKATRPPLPGDYIL